MKVFKKVLQCFLFLILILILAYSILILVIRPSSNRTWNKDQEIPATIVLSTSTISIKNIRNFSYTTTSEYTPHYYDKVVTRGSVKKVWFIVEPFARPGFAHTFLSFEFDDETFLSISVEIRKEVGEEFSPFKGIFEEYEIMYVVVDERDALTLRAVYRDNPVHIYPTVASKEAVQQLFVNMMQHATALKDAPEFYNTLTNTCATKIADHINEIVPSRVTWDYRILLPKNSDVLAYELGFIDNNVPLAELRQTYLANERIKANIDHPNFSVIIRER